MDILKKGLIFGVITYKKVASPFLRKACIYQPTCSDYAIEAINKYGAIIGAYLSIKRVLKCNGYFKGGYDPVL